MFCDVENPTSLPFLTFSVRETESKMAGLYSELWTPISLGLLPQVTGSLSSFFLPPPSFTEI